MAIPFGRGVGCDVVHLGRQIDQRRIWTPTRTLVRQATRRLRPAEVLIRQNRLEAAQGSDRMSHLSHARRSSISRA